MAARYRFGGVEFDAGTGALEPLGTRLPRQPARLLELLIEKRGEVVSRREIRDELWSDTNVEFDKSLHFCVHQVRTALGDSASEPRFVETVPRRGYRLVPEVERVDGAGAAHHRDSATGLDRDRKHARGDFRDPSKRDVFGTASNVAGAEATAVAAASVASADPAARGVRAGRKLLVAVGLGLVALLVAIALWTSGFRDLETDRPIATDPAEPGLVRVGVMPFEPPADWAHGSVPSIAEWILEELTLGGQGRAWIVGPSTTAAYSRSDSALAELAADYDLDYIVNGRFLSDAEPPAMLAELIRASDGAHIWVQRIERFDNGRGLGLEISAAVSERLLEPGGAE